MNPLNESRDRYRGQDPEVSATKVYTSGQLTDRSTDRELPRFESEELLRQVVAKLLLRMPHVSDVQLLHGRQELGKDIVFRTDGPLGDSVHCACVVKNARISGSVDSASGARTVFHQTEQALDTPFIDENGYPQRIQHAYIISPADTSQEAMASIQGRMMERSGQITFVTGQQFFALLREYWPGFFRDEYMLLEQNLEGIAERGLTDDLREAAISHGLQPPDQSERTIYVERTLSIRLEGYDLLVVKQRVPEWRSEKATNWTTFLRRLAICLPHLERWSLFQTQYSGGAEKLRGLVTELSRDLEAAYQSQSEGETYGGHARKKGSLFDSNPVLVSRATSVRTVILEGLQPLCAANDTTATFVFSNKSEPSSLQWATAIAASRLLDCLTAAPVPLLKTLEHRIVSLSEAQARVSKWSWFIVGPAGFGKTYFCRWNALLDAESYRTEKANVLPVYVPLNRLVRRELTTFQEAFLGAAGRSAILPADVLEARKEKGFDIRLYLDGLDEVSSLDTRRTIARLARDAHDAGIQIVLTSRDYVRMPELGWLPKLSLDMLDEASRRELAERILGSVDSTREFFRQLERTPSLRDIFGVPLMARLILLVFKETKGVPENRSRLYRTFVDLLSGGWDLAKGVVRESQFGRVIKTNVLCKLAQTVHEERLRTFGIPVIQRAARASANRLGSDAMNALCQELIRDGLLTHSSNTFYFSHMSFQEFLCAAYYFGCPQTEGADSALSRFLSGDDWWREVVAFYIGLSESPDGVSQWLKVRTIHKEQRGGEVLRFFAEAFPKYDS